MAHSRAPTRSKEREWAYKPHESKPSLWTVGFYKSDGEWTPTEEHAAEEAAAQRVHLLRLEDRERKLSEENAILRDGIVSWVGCGSALGVGMLQLVYIWAPPKPEPHLARILIFGLCAFCAWIASLVARNK